jgi:hypothetical protein
LARILLARLRKKPPMPNSPNGAKIEEHFFTDDGEVPNNAALPLLFYRGVLEAGPQAAALCEGLCARNG